MIFLKFAFCISSILITGYTILRLFFYPKEKMAFGESIILSFGIGVGFAGLEIFFLSLTKKPLTVSHLLLFQIALFVFAVLKFKKNFFYWQASHDQRKFICAPLAVFFLSIILLEIIYIFLESFSLPFTAWDAWGDWGFRAKIFFTEKTLPFEVWTQWPWIRYTPGHPEYPILIPFAETYIYLFLGQVHEPLVKLFCSFYYAGIIGLFYYQIKRKFTSEFALGSCLCLATIPNLTASAITGYMDVPLTFYTTGGILYIWRYLKEKDNSSLLLGGLLTGLAMWTKNEGISSYAALFLSCVLFCLLFKINIDKKKFLLIVLFMPLLIYLPWLVFRYCLGIKVEYFQRSFTGLLDLARQRVPLMANIWIRNCLDIQKWNILWISFIFSLIWFFVKPHEKLSAFLLSIFALQLIFYFTIFTILPKTLPMVEWYVITSVDRLPLHIAPLVLFFICQQIGKKWMTD